MAHDDDPDNTPIFCAGCGTDLKPGSGNFYVVKIEAFADPSPPVITEEGLKRDARAEIRRLIEQMHDLSERELSEQVHRRLTLHLCGPCYRRWIENPVRWATGGDSGEAGIPH
jgi:hypothetical protein